MHLPKLSEYFYITFPSLWVQYTDVLETGKGGRELKLTQACLRRRQVSQRKPTFCRAAPALRLVVGTSTGRRGGAGHRARSAEGAAGV